MVKIMIKIMNNVFWAKKNSRLSIPEEDACFSVHPESRLLV